MKKIAKYPKLIEIQYIEYNESLVFNILIWEKKKIIKLLEYGFERTSQGARRKKNQK
jgi:hypothetical protein